MRQAALLTALLSGAACAASSPDIIQVGPWFSARSPAEVQVFSSRDQISKPWGAIAVIHGTRFPAGADAPLERQRKMARKMAAGIGADGVVMVEETVRDGSTPDGSPRSETYISALAVKYVTDLSTAVK